MELTNHSRANDAISEALNLHVIVRVRQRVESEEDYRGHGGHISTWMIDDEREHRIEGPVKEVVAAIYDDIGTRICSAEVERDGEDAARRC